MKKKSEENKASKTSKPTPEEIHALVPANPAAGKNYQMIWENGVPRAVVQQPHFEKKTAAITLSNIGIEQLNFPYEGDDPRYFGKTKGEAMMAQLIDAASEGDESARKEVMDRVMGKPQQNIKSVSVKGTLGEFLDTIDTSEADVIDI